ncbi:uncharacterized protein LOC143252278 [Tachypleus tridentatus]|uniref:uncharacterized protein LOC143252278 n=1 Tax=Tachypleus tridentatus TaxID=6853 RepID=UPI003FD676E4
MAAPGVVTLNLSQVPLVLQHAGTSYNALGQTQTLITLPATNPTSNSSDQVQTLLLPINNSDPAQGTTLMTFPVQGQLVSGENFQILSPNNMQALVPVVNCNTQGQALFLSSSSNLLSSQKNVQTAIFTESHSEEQGRQMQNSSISSTDAISKPSQKIETVVLPAGTSIVENSRLVEMAEHQREMIALGSQESTSSLIERMDSTTDESEMQIQTVLLPSSSSSGTVRQVHTLLLPVNEVQNGQELHASVQPMFVAVSKNSANQAQQVYVSGNISSTLSLSQVISVPISNVVLAKDPQSNQIEQSSVTSAGAQASNSSNVMVYLPQEGLLVEVPNLQQDNRIRQWYQDSELATRGLTALTQVVTPHLSLENISLNSPSESPVPQVVHLVQLEIESENANLCEEDDESVIRGWLEDSNITSQALAALNHHLSNEEVETNKKSSCTSSIFM